MSQANLPDKTHLGYAQLIVADLDQSLGFYQGILGLSILGRENGEATLAAPLTRTRLLVLEERFGARPKPPRTIGLFHIALRYPHRIALAQALQRLVYHRWPLLGASDHRVSEALYLSDPDGLGVELYADRPRDTWPRRDGAIAMTTDPLDVRGLLAEADRVDLGGGAPEIDLELGHIHLQVADLGLARRFFHGVLGFAVTQENYPGALFVAAGGYHHHIGLNVWAGVGAPAPPPDAVGLRAFSIQLPDAGAFELLRVRLLDNGIRMDDLGDAEGARGMIFEGPGAARLRVYISGGE